MKLVSKHKKNNGDEAINKLEKNINLIKKSKNVTKTNNPKKPLNKKKSSTSKKAKSKSNVKEGEIVEGISENLKENEDEKDTINPQNEDTQENGIFTIEKLKEILESTSENNNDVAGLSPEHSVIPKYLIE